MSMELELALRKIANEVARKNANKKVVRCPKGADRREVPLGEVVVPDLWHVAMYLNAIHEERAAAAVLECWHLAHDLLLNLKGDVEK